MEDEMKILKIISKGFIVNIPGIRKIRTPVKIDISSFDENYIISHLHKNGILEYEIIERIGDINKVKIKNTLTTKHENSKEIIIDPKNSSESLIHSIERQTKSIDEIKQLLERFLTSDNFYKKEVKIIGNKKEKVINNIEDDPEDFIPMIDLKNIKLRGTLKTDEIK